MQSKLHIKVGDNVYVTTGVNKGKTAEVVSINRKTQRVVISGEGLKMIKKHVKPNVDKDNPEGGIIDRNPSTHISNLMVVDPSNGKPTRIGRKRVESEINGVKKTVSVRFSKKTGEVIK